MAALTPVLLLLAPPLSLDSGPDGEKPCGPDEFDVPDIE